MAAHRSLARLRMMNQEYVDDLVRTFVALTLPDRIVDAVRRIQASARIDLPRGLRWTRPEQTHMTLAFLGDIPADRLDDLSRIVSETSRGFEPFDVHVSSIGGFPRAQRPRVVWAGVSGSGIAHFTEMHERLWAGIASIKAKPKPDERPFHPHITLARVPGPQPSRLADWMEKNAEWDFGLWTVTEMTLIRSVLTPSGPNYETVATAFLGQTSTHSPAS
jgi:2'-5' RNA ligase